MEKRTELCRNTKHLTDCLKKETGGTMRVNEPGGQESIVNYSEFADRWTTH